MPFFQLSENDKSFPPAHFADMEGMIAVGGDLSPERVVNAYSNGIFFWFGPMDMIKWWSPDPRVVLFTRDATTEGDFEFTLDKDFEKLLQACQKVQNNRSMNEFWITEEMKDTYRALQKDGYVRSLEIWENGELAGGIFGIVIGKLFFAEYLLEINEQADTFALNKLGRILLEENFALIDLQKVIESVGAAEISEISRLEFLDIVKRYKT